LTNLHLLLDQGLPRSTTTILRERGYDVVHVAEIGLREADDTEIIDYARKQGQIIITLDGDFHALLKVGAYSAPSVIRLRVEGLRGEAVAELVEQVLARASDEIQRGALVSVDETTIRVHRLEKGNVEC
jgi:predicted nuclease of predicted toxin-antitoxin system